MSAGRPLSRSILYPLCGLFILVVCISSYWAHAPVQNWSACGLSSNQATFRQVEPAQATLHVVVFEKNTNKEWSQYWAIPITSQNSMLRLHAAVGSSKVLFGLEMPYQRRAFFTHIQTGRNAHGSTKSFTYDVKWLAGNS